MAIAFDAASSRQFASGVSSITFAHTVGSGNNRILFAGGSCADTSKTLTATFNGVAMTALINETGGGDRSYLFYLLAPDTGTHDIVITLSSGTDDMSGQACSYTGVNQAAPDNSGSISDSTSPFRLSITSVLDNCWMVAFWGQASSSGTLSAEAGTTIRSPLFAITCMGDSNGVISPAGSKTLGLTSGEGFSFSIVGATFAPVQATTYPVSASENLTNSIIERFSRAWTAPRSNSDTVGLQSEGTTRAVAYQRTRNESFTITESINAFRGIFITIMESVAITETFGRVLTAIRGLSESISIVDQYIKKYVLNLTEAIQVSDTYSRTANFLSRVLSEAVSITDHASFPLNWINRTKPTAIWRPRQRP